MSCTMVSKWFNIKLMLASACGIKYQHKIKKNELNGDLQKVDEIKTNELKLKHSIRAWISKPMRPNQQLRLSCLSLSSPYLTSMSRKSKTSLLKMWVRIGGGDNASVKWWASWATYEGSSNVVEGVANMSIHSLVEQSCFPLLGYILVRHQISNNIIWGRPIFLNKTGHPPSWDLPRPLRE